MSWIDTCYSRLLVDNHITDQKPEYMSRFNPEEYVRLVKLSGVESAMVYACDHNGNCYYPTQTGHMHGGLGGRDGFGETVRGLKAARIVPIAYYTVNYHNDSVQRFPECSMRDINGETHSGRYHFSCPNHPRILEFYRKQLAEILHYPVDGIFIDMTFWPMICCCDACRAKFRSTSGMEIPEKIDWKEPQWLAFQHFRENSLADFAKELTRTVRQIRPDATVTHQFSPVLHGWYLGQTAGIAEASDYASGDFYGGRRQQRLAVKVFDAYSTKKPFEFMTSRCVTLYDHTSEKSDDELFLHALTTLANGGAYFFIDAINPDGTLEESFYRRLHVLNGKLAPFKNMIASHHPVPVAEVGVYFSMNSCVSRQSSGTSLRELKEGGGNMELRKNDVVEELLGIADLLQSLHIPYRIVTERTEDYSGLKALIAANADYLPDTEYEKFRRFTASGGLFIATGSTSRFNSGGQYSGNFILADVFGVNDSGRDTETCSYLALPDRFLSSDGISPLATASTAKVHAFVNLPDFPVNDPVHYASIHSNPPGKTTVFAGMTEHQYGRGTCFRFYSNLLGIRRHSQQEFGRNFLRTHLPAFVTESENLPNSTEITLLKSTTSASLLLGIVNYQEELPNIPLHDIRMTIRLGKQDNIRKIIRASDGQEVAFRQENGLLSFEIPRLENGEILELQKQEDKFTAYSGKDCGECGNMPL